VTAAVDPSKLTVAIVALGNAVTAGKVELRSELSLARSSILYADEILMFSPWADLAKESIALRETLHGPEIWGTLAANPELRDRLAGSPETARILGEIASIASTNETERDYEVTELKSAEVRGQLRHVSLMRKGHEDEEGTFLSRLLDEMIPLLEEPSVHAVFDVRAAAVFRNLSKSDARLAAATLGQRNREAELGAGLIARLPAFPDAPIDALLDLKSDLAGPLLRYRSAIHKLEAGLTQELASPEIDAEIQTEWRGTVAPALQDIEDELTDHGFVRELARASSTSARDLVISGASLSIALATVGQIAASISAAAGAAGMATQATARALVDRASNRRSLGKSDFYYLYEVGRAGQIHK
jgi:hypothetical protein